MNSLKKLLMPEVFQGNYKKTPYFEGWYFKLQAQDGRIIAFIPGISLTGNDPHSFIQTVSDGVSAYKRYPLEAFKFAPDRLEISVAGSVFTKNGLHIDTDNLSGNVRFKDPVPFSRRRYGTGIMGPFALMPFLECRHGVVMVKSGLDGFIENRENSQKISLDGGNGYIEKDWGSLFPDPYLWVHAFLEDGGSFMLSAARIPFLGRNFSGLAAFLYAQGRVRRITTYGGAYLDKIAYSDDGSLRLELKAPAEKISLTIRAGATVALIAPERAGMRREIRESVKGSLQIELSTHAGRRLFADSSQNASIELSGSILKLGRQ
jgi:tocopherol cyclase